MWLVPFALFVSLSAGDNVLPSMGSEYATGARVSSVGLAGSSGGGGGSSSTANVLSTDGKVKNKGMAKALVDGVRDWVAENGEVMGFWRGERTGRF